MTKVKQEGENGGVFSVIWGFEWVLGGSWKVIKGVDICGDLLVDL